jgi:hypothetical protein
MMAKDSETLAIAIGAVACGFGIAIGAVLFGGGDERVRCYEDEVIVWNGNTNRHDRCTPIDVFIDTREQ